MGPGGVDDSITQLRKGQPQVTIDQGLNLRKSFGRCQNKSPDRAPLFICAHSGDTSSAPPLTSDEPSGSETFAQAPFGRLRP
ncbi:unannotated protein [freshwater metagenome]|uniref:Unannotated protein n=1 Tax=freshwater metagenome TaxID=449393 RepID=A0A6J5YHG2_9ZZZZ